jgi:IS5 family transposase
LGTAATSVTDETAMSEKISEAVEPTHQVQLVLDATVVEQAIRFPIDLSLLNEACEFTETIIDTLCAHPKGGQKPRTYRQQARAVPRQLT